MWRPVLRLILWLMVLCGAGIVAVRVLAYDPSYFAALETALLDSPGCQHNTCYLGIRPGGTTMRDGYRILTDRFTDVEPHFLDYDHTNPFTVMWQQHDSAFFPEGRIDSRFGIALVDYVWLPAEATWGEIWLTFGAPDSFAVYDSFQIARYPHFSVQTNATCSAFWIAPSGFLITDRRPPDTNVPRPEIRRAVCQTTAYQ